MRASWTVATKLADGPGKEARFTYLQCQCLPDDRFPDQAENAAFSGLWDAPFRTCSRRIQSLPQMLLPPIALFPRRSTPSNACVRNGYALAMPPGESPASHRPG